MGELSAYLYGWSQILNRSILITLLARGLGSVIVQTVGERLIEHHFPLSSSLINEDSIGITSQLMVCALVLCGLQVSYCLTLLN